MPSSSQAPVLQQPCWGCRRTPIFSHLCAPLPSLVVCCHHPLLSLLLSRCFAYCRRVVPTRLICFLLRSSNLQASQPCAATRSCTIPPAVFTFATLPHCTDPIIANISTTLHSARTRKHATCNWRARPYIAEPQRCTLHSCDGLLHERYRAMGCTGSDEIRSKLKDVTRQRSQALQTVQYRVDGGVHQPNGRQMAAMPAMRLDLRLVGLCCGLSLLNAVERRRRALREGLPAGLEAGGGERFSVSGVRSRCQALLPGAWSREHCGTMEQQGPHLSAPRPLSNPRCQSVWRRRG